MSKIASVLPFFKKREDKKYDQKGAKESPCIDCGICLEVCPQGLWPAILLEDIKAGRFADAKKHGIDACDDCGDCTAECPVSIPLFKYLRLGIVLSYYDGDKSGLVPALIELQSNFGYLPEYMLDHISKYLNLSIGHIRSVASFYKSFRLTPPGRKHVCICTGTACHITGAPLLTREAEKLLGIKNGETSADNEYTLDTVACVGCCALAPVITVNGEPYGKMDSEKITKQFQRSGKKGKNHK